MKTTFDIPEDLLVRAKKRAAELRRPLRSLVTEGLRGQLSTAGQQRPLRKATRRRIRWVTTSGGLPPGLDLAKPRAYARLVASAPMIAVDTNLRVYAHRRGVAEHRAAQRAIERASEDRRGGSAFYSTSRSLSRPSSMVQLSCGLTIAAS